MDKLNSSRETIVRLIVVWPIRPERNRRED